MKGIKPGLHFGSKKNATSASGEQHSGVYTNSKSDFERNGHAATICVGAIVAVALLALCGLLCYRQTRKRRRQSGIDQEKFRREAIRQAVRAKLQELEDVHDSTPWLEQTRIRTSSVTFGDVVLIDPSQSPGESPVAEHRSYDGDDSQHQVYHEPHHHNIYSGSKRRVHHIPYRRDYSHISYHQRNQAQTLERQLNVHGDHTTDKNIRKYTNSDHPRFSEHTMVEQTKPKPHARETSVNSTNIQMPNNDHHKLSLHKKIQPATKHVPEASVNFTNIPMPNNEHHKLSLRRKFQPATEHARDAMVSSASLIHMKNNEHHKLSVHKKVEPTAKHARDVSVNSNNSSHVYPAHRSNGSSNNSSHVYPAHHSNASSNNSSHVYPAHHSNGSSNNTHVYPAHNSNGSSTSTHVPQNSSATFNRKVVLHNGYTQRIGKRSSATIPIGMDAVY